LVWVRSLVGFLLAAIVLFAIWIWWVSAVTDPLFLPSVGEFRLVLVSLAMILLTIVVVQAPAVLAGSLAGERERGVLQLLLTTAVGSREIVLGRLLGKLSQVGMIVLSGLPLLALLVAWNGYGLAYLAAITLVLAAAGLGGGGIAVGASVLSRRGRDALLAVYILMLILILSPLSWLLGVPVPIAGQLELLNPFYSMSRLIWSGDVEAALEASAFWLMAGLAGLVVASWRLRPSGLAQTGSLPVLSRRRRVPPPGERPMLWKELYIERVGSLGRFGRWLGALITGSIGLGSLVVAAIILWSLLVRPDPQLSAWSTGVLELLLSGFAGTAMGWLLQWGVGLRGAVSVASERERGTWDALLMSPLAPAEIGRAKVYGSLHALRYMAGAMVLAWTLGVIFEAISIRSYVTWIAGTAVGCALMGAIGVRSSLSLPTATKAMTWTISLWLAAQAFVAFVALSIIAIVMLLCFLGWSFALRYGLITMKTPPWFPMGWKTGWAVTTDLVSLVITILVVADTALRFDRIAGRMAGGAVAATVDSWLHGHSLRPVLLPGRKKAARGSPPPPSADLVITSPVGRAIPEQS
jgi:ABC-type transport system involved in multi-copper enzyme maturation permease subunit